MAKNKVETKEKFPVYVYLKSVNPYKNKVICNGITISTDKKTLIPNTTMLNKLKQIENYIIIESASV